MSDFQLEYDAALTMAKLHFQGHDEITALDASMPAVIDGGDGAELIASALAALATDAGTLAVINDYTGTQLRRTVDLVTGVDASSAEEFRKIQQRLHP